MKSFEIVGYGFNGATDATDDRIYWVYAESHDVTRAAIAGTLAAGFHDMPDGDTSTDFTLPADNEKLRAALLQWVPDVLPVTLKSARTGRETTVRARNVSGDWVINERARRAACARLGADWTDPNPKIQALGVPVLRAIDPDGAVTFTIWGE